MENSSKKPFSVLITINGKDKKLRTFAQLTDAVDHCGKDLTSLDKLAQKAQKITIAFDVSYSGEKLITFTGTINAQHPEIVKRMAIVKSENKEYERRRKACSNIPPHAF